MARRVVRWNNGQSTETMVEPTPFGPERAQQIRNAGSQYSNYDKHMTDGEVAYVLEIWDKMSRESCFYDALCRIAWGKLP